LVKGLYQVAMDSSSQPSQPSSRTQLVQNKPAESNDLQVPN